MQAQIQLCKHKYTNTHLDETGGRHPLIWLVTEEQLKHSRQTRVISTQLGFEIGFLE